MGAQDTPSLGTMGLTRPVSTGRLPGRVFFPVCGVGGFV
jgi:hypothetical protein